MGGVSFVDVDGVVVIRCSTMLLCWSDNGCGGGVNDNGNVDFK